MTIEKMKTDLKILDERIDELSSERIALRQRIADAQALFAVGERVTYEGATCIWEISSVRPGYSFSDEPHYYGAKIKKDGAPGALRSRIYPPWKKPLTRVA